MGPPMGPHGPQFFFRLLPPFFLFGFWPLLFFGFWPWFFFQLLASGSSGSFFCFPRLLGIFRQTLISKIEEESLQNKSSDTSFLAGLKSMFRKSKRKNLSDSICFKIFHSLFFIHFFVHFFSPFHSPFWTSPFTFSCSRNFSATLGPFNPLCPLSGSPYNFLVLRFLLSTAILCKREQN